VAPRPEIAAAARPRGGAWASGAGDGGELLALAGAAAAAVAEPNGEDLDRRGRTTQAI